MNNKVNSVSIYDLFNKYGIDNCNIFLLENYNCNDINELRAKEGEYIKKFKCINKIIPGRTIKEYYETIKIKLKNINFNIDLKTKIKLKNINFNIDLKTKIKYSNIKN